ncbi:MAG: hypothetical protein KGL53_06705, partial [Elusimicrobia bacterium]|nr:hypothetical protein [Elusimicrobiota bacterium]
DVEVFDLKTNAVLGKVRTAPGSDDIRYDPASGKVLVVAGDARALVAFDPAVDLKHAEAAPPLALGGVPEGLAVDGKGWAYVNLVDKDRVAVVDTRKMTVFARWPVTPGGKPVGLAVDPETHRLFIGCRKPARLVVLQTETGKRLADFPLGKGNDAAVFDDGKAYASCGDGSLTVVGEKGGRLSLMQTLRTARGARTLGIESRTHRLYLPAADFGRKRNKRGWPVPVAGTFRVLVVGR